MEKTKQLDDVAMRCVAMTSPAVSFQYYTNDPKRQNSNYPPQYEGKVPLKVKLMKDVKPDFPQLASPDTIALMNNEYYAWVNSHGAVSAILPNGEKLGLYPREFVVSEWHPLLQHNPHGSK